MRIKIYLAAVLGAALLVVPSVGYAAFNDVTRSTGDFEIVLPGNGFTYTVDSTSKFESMTVNSATIDFTVRASSVVLLTSSNRSNFTLSGDTTCSTVVVSCGTQQSTITINCANNSEPHTLTVTPSGTCSQPNTGGGGGSTNPPASSGGGGGGGGGGAAPAPTPAPAPAPAAQPTPAPKPATPTTPAPKPTPAYQFKRFINVGSRGADVQELEKFLKSSSYLAAKQKIDTYFDTATATGLKKFQSYYGLKENGLGIKTRGVANALLRGEEVAKYVAPLPPKYIFKSTLRSGSRGEEVKQLQLKLQSLGYLAKSITANGTFGSSTAAALKKFQDAKGIKESGAVGVKTRAALNE